jgi:hypothetical protein
VVEAVTDVAVAILEAADGLAVRVVIPVEPGRPVREPTAWGVRNRSAISDGLLLDGAGLLLEGRSFDCAVTISSKDQYRSPRRRFTLGNRLSANERLLLELEITNVHRVAFQVGARSRASQVALSVVRP